MDFKDFERGAAVDAAGAEVRKGFWWKAPKASVHESVTAVVGGIQKRQSYRSDANLRHLRLYGGAPAMGFGPRAERISDGSEPVIRSKPLPVTANIIRSMTDTVTAKIGKSKPKPTFVTSGGNWGLQQKAKLLDKFCQGQFYEDRLYEKGPTILRDAGVLGTGLVKVYEANNRVRTERVLVEELYVDDVEALYGEPRSLYQTKIIAREVLASQYESRKQTIRDAAGPGKERALVLPQQQSEADMVEVVEAWHLPSGPGAKDGRHVIAISNATLLDETWEDDCFPFAVLRYSTRPLGWYGEGIAERQAGRQLVVNRVLKRIDEIIQRCSTSRAWVDRQSKVVKEQLRNAVGDIVEFTGRPPIFQAPNMVPPELFGWLQQLVREGYELEGISMLSAQAKKPSGLDAAVALREFNDIESERFVVLGQAYEQFFLDVGRLMIRAAKRIAERKEEERDEEGSVLLDKDGKPKTKKGDYEVKYPTKKGLVRIRWSDISLEDDAFAMQMFPSSSLPTTPGARKQAVQELLAGGLIEPQTAKRLLDFPDLEEENSIEFAQFEDIHSAIDDILERGEYRTPEPYENLEYGKKRFQSAYLRARTQGVPEERLQLLRDWMDAAEDMLNTSKAASAPPVPSAPAGMPPEAAPMPPGLPMAA